MDKQVKISVNFFYIFILTSDRNSFPTYNFYLQNSLFMHTTYSSALDDDLSDVDFSHLVPYPTKLFPQLSDEQCQIFEKLLNKKRGESFAIEKELTGIIKPFKGLLQKKLSYFEILKKITDHYKIPTSGTDVKKIEEEILVFKFQENFDKLSPQEKEKFQQELYKVLESKNLESSQLASLGTVGALALAEMSGMGLFIMASTFVGGLTSILGITLPFAFYTGMSSFLAFVTGPVGWAVGIGALAYSLRNDNLESITKKFRATLNASQSLVKGNYELASIIVVQICANRIILNQENTKEMEKLTSAIGKEKERKKEVISKAEVIEVQLKKLLKEKRNTEREVEKLSASIKKKEDSIGIHRSKLI